MNSKRPRNRGPSSRESGNVKKILAALCVALAFALGAIVENEITYNQAEDNLTSTTKQRREDAGAKATTQSEAAYLSFMVNALDAADSEVTAIVHITGESDDGETVDDYYRADPSTLYILDYGAGIYQIELSEDDIDGGGRIFKHDKVEVVYTGEKSLQAELNLAIDEDKTRAQEEARLEAEEEAREEEKAEEQTQRKTKENAKRKAEKKAEEEENEAKKEAETEEAAATTTMTRSMPKGNQNSYTVYVTETGTKYHLDGCQYLKDSKIPIDINDAQSKGFKPCRKCFGR